MCYLCGVEMAQFRCHQCGPGQVLCTACDSNIHQQKPLHDRQVWLDGFWLPIAPTITSTGTEVSLSSQGTCTQPTIGTQNSIAIFHAVRCMPSHFPLCGGQKQTELVPTTSMRTVVTLQGSLCCFCRSGLNCYFYLI